LQQNLENSLLFVRVFPEEDSVASEEEHVRFLQLSPLDHQPTNKYGIDKISAVALRYM